MYLQFPRGLRLQPVDLFAVVGDGHHEVRLRLQQGVGVQRGARAQVGDLRKRQLTALGRVGGGVVVIGPVEPHGVYPVVPQGRTGLYVGDDPGRSVPGHYQAAPVVGELPRCALFHDLPPFCALCHEVASPTGITRRIGGYLPIAPPSHPSPAPLCPSAGPPGRSSLILRHGIAAMGAMLLRCLLLDRNLRV
ncbi:DNA polymerase III alpha subunit [Streptomyces sp. NBRC 110611]|nr:DNA polymerase III alpha subunit [Streptomyces sp. NBRC 110611]